MAAELDEVDILLLTALQEDADRTNVELARLAGLSPAATLHRVRRLKESGVIRVISARLDPAAAGFPLQVYVTATLARHDPRSSRVFDDLIRALPQIIAADNVAGETDYLLTVVARDVAELPDGPRQPGHPRRPAAGDVPAAGRGQAPVPAAARAGNGRPRPPRPSPRPQEQTWPGPGMRRPSHGLHRGMKIAVIGKGNIGGSLGSKWHAAGYDVVYGARDASGRDPAPGRAGRRCSASATR